jgi:hypothetical protein
MNNLKDFDGNVSLFLDAEVPQEEIETINGAQYQPIWVIENLLDELTSATWNRCNHKFEVKEFGDDVHILTSIEVHVNYGGYSRVLIGGSSISGKDYPDNPNPAQVGIAEATKAAVKVLGRRFGRYLNDRDVNKETGKRTEKKAVKIFADVGIMLEYTRAIQENDIEKINNLQAAYDLTKK